MTAAHGDPSSSHSMHVDGIPSAPPVPPPNARSPRRVVLVGHCGPDQYMLKSAVARVVADAKIEMVSNREALEAHVNGDTVLLINRALDGRFGTGSGIELIAQLVERKNPPIAILISNFPEAQQQAVATGARPGFGKTELYAERTAEILRDAVLT